MLKKSLNLCNMSKKSLILFVVFAGMAGIYSCGKEVSHEQPSLSSIEKVLQYKWNLVSINEFSGTGVDSLRYEGTDSDYFNFLVNDSIYTYYQSTAGSGIYFLQNDTTLLVGDGISFDTVYIRTLNSHLLVLSQPDPPGGPVVDTLMR
ncbi:MAG: hypothetical protein P4L51_10270 [Puia sp.]|nr:hypothetical protein [Puia sp.]